MLEGHREALPKLLLLLSWLLAPSLHITLQARELIFLLIDDALQFLVLRLELAFEFVILTCTFIEFDSQLSQTVRDDFLALSHYSLDISDHCFNAF